MTTGIRQLIGNAINSVSNALFSRTALSEIVAGQETRDVDTTCGYPEVASVADYFEMIARFGVPGRVNSVLPDESWKVPPLVYETEDESDVTEFEAAWEALFANPNTHPWHFLHRADVESGKGFFGGLLLGIADGQTLDQPVRVRDGKPNRLMFLRVLSQQNMIISKYNTDPTSEEFGMPETYSVMFGNPEVGTGEQWLTGSIGPTAWKKIEVHASRILHVADNCATSQVFGIPRLQPVYNYLLDLKKVGGGSAEMFWQGASPGWAIETNPTILDPQVDKETLKDEFAGWRNGLQRFIALEGMSIKSLAPQVSDPSNHVKTQLLLICAAIGVPLRAFLGAEAGQLASETDRDNFNDRLTRRQNNYLTPFLIVRFVKKLVAAGVLPEPKQIMVDWADLNSMKEKDKAAISMQRVQALLQYVTSGAETIMPLREFLTKIMYFSSKDADAIVAAVKANPTLYTKELWEHVQAGTGNPSDPTTKTGAAGKRNAQG